MDYIVTFEYGYDSRKVRVNNSLSEKDAIRSAIVKARLYAFPNLDDASIKIKTAAFHKKIKKP